MRFFMKLLLTMLFVLYLAVLTKLILFKYIPISEITNLTNFGFYAHHWNGSNLIPFKTIQLYWNAENLNLNIRIENLVGNIIGFVPFGFILPMLVKRFQKLIMVLIATCYLSFVYEGLQFLTGFGSFDVDDLILNTLGGILGYFAYKIVLQVMSYMQRNSTNKTLTILRYFIY